jgi:type II secretory pathway predicted ATPase ExeA
MYRSHWGLGKTPFGSRPNPAFFYQSPAVEEALARLQFLVDENRRMGLVLAAPGGGKSVLLNVLADELKRPGRQVALVNLFGLSPGEFLWQLAAQWGLGLDGDTPTGALWRAIADHLVENRCQKIDTIVLLDDGDEASRDVLDTVARLALLEPSREARLTIVVASKPEGVSKLGGRILELAELRVELDAWDPVDTQSYVESALKLAGGAAGAFEPEAVRRLHELADGVPRRVNQLADLALLAAAGRKLPRVDADTVAGVSEELVAAR